MLKFGMNDELRFLLADKFDAEANRLNKRWVFTGDRQDRLGAQAMRQQAINILFPETEVEQPVEKLIIPRAQLD